MNTRTKNLLAVAGVISTVVGVVWSIPSFLKEMYLLAIASTFLLIGGLVLLAIAFGD